MAINKNINNGVKYTVVLPENDIKDLKEFANKKIVNSVNAAVREAVYQYIANVKRETYKKEMIEAANDPEFINRNNSTLKDFQYTDNEAERKIPKW